MKHTFPFCRVLIRDDLYSFGNFYLSTVCGSLGAGGGAGKNKLGDESDDIHLYMPLDKVEEMYDSLRDLGLTM